ncbi:MAG: class I SAM-dependent methyltransferase [Calditrichaeota bacterium]|nr:class I SAM-dependent methyltransferase [Calditrichota bacterium]
MLKLFKKKKPLIKREEDKRSATEWMLDQITFYDVESILEIGVTSGRTVVDLAKRLPYCSINGIDLEKSNINQAQQLIDSNKLTDRIALQVSSSEEIPFNSDMFSKVLAIDVYSLWEKPSISLFEIRRVLKENGKAYFYMSNPERVSELSHLPTADELCELLERTGFTSVSAREHRNQSKLLGTCIRGKKVA